MSHGVIHRSQRNWQPRDIGRMNLDGGAAHFLPRLVACLALADGEAEFRRKALERAAAVNRELGTVFGMAECGTLQGAGQVAELWLKMRGRLVTRFAPSDAARIWFAGAHGHLETESIPYWQHVQKFYASSQPTAALKRMAEELA